MLIKCSIPLNMNQRGQKMFAIIPSYYLNIGSLIFGLLSWFLPAIQIIRRKDAKTVYAMISLFLCSLAILFQLFYQVYLIAINDWSALMDTAPAAAVTSSVLLVFCTVLNWINFSIRTKYNSNK